MEPLPRTLPPWRWDLGEHLCTPEAPALSPRKISGVEKENHYARKEKQACCCTGALTTDSSHRFPHWGGGLGLQDSGAFSNSSPTVSNPRIISLGGA